MIRDIKKRKKCKLLLFAFTGLIGIPGCNRNHSSETDSLVYNFADSVKIIRNLLHSNALPKILDEHDPEKLDFLINNWSPAQMAFESEVLSCTLPVLVCFYQKELNVIPFLEELANNYDGKLKIITIAEDKFPFITQLAVIESFPSFLLIKNRNEIVRWVGNFYKEDLLALL
jgi:thioredoxin 1